MEMKDMVERMTIMASQAELEKIKTQLIDDIDKRLEELERRFNELGESDES